MKTMVVSGVTRKGAGKNESRRLFGGRIALGILVIVVILYT